jgi:hypothetical protein
MRAMYYFSVLIRTDYRTTSFRFWGNHIHFTYRFAIVAKQIQRIVPLPFLFEPHLLLYWKRSYFIIGRFTCTSSRLQSTRREFNLMLVVLLGNYSYCSIGTNIIVVGCEFSIDNGGNGQGNEYFLRKIFLRKNLILKTCGLYVRVNSNFSVTDWVSQFALFLVYCTQIENWEFTVARTQTYMMYLG